MLFVFKKWWLNEGKVIVVDKFKYIYGYIDDNYMLVLLVVLVFLVCIIICLRCVFLILVLKINYDFWVVKYCYDNR